MINRTKAKKIYKKLRSDFYALVNFLFINSITLAVFKKIATDGTGSNRCLEKGFLPVPVHYYSPIPDIDDLKKRKVWDKISQMSGLDFNKKKQLANLKNLGQKFSKECDWPLEPTLNPADFYVNNQGFSYGCASILYSMIRKHQPKNIIEIGSGLSSKVIAKAIQVNAAEGVKTKYTIIDPYPGEDIANRTVKSNRLITKCVEVVNPKIFEQLGQNDILFIDSSHSVKIGSDVNFLYLDILPRLKPGVIIHIHDISLPYEYSKVYATNEVFRQFWTEQYLLQSFLCLNNDFEILLAMNYLMKDHLPQFTKAFPYYDPKIHRLTSGSFWIQRKGRQ